jgi:hypothetical protein
MRKVNLLLVLGGLLVGLVLASHVTLRAQGGRKPADDASAAQGEVVAPEKPSASGSIQDALHKPFQFSFGHPTTLADLAKRLSHELAAPVVLDLAALERLDIKPEATVKLEIGGVRLKTGLKLLLDQVGLTYRVVPEDNLLILTDKEGSDDPLDRIVAELHELHRDVHELQDTVDELRELSSPSGGEGAKVRKPTIIEELPENAEPRPRDKDEAPSARPAPRPEPNTRPHGSPSARPRTSL